MAKNKTRKNQKKNGAVESEIIIYIYALICIMLAVIGALEIGFVGRLTTSAIKYFVGNLYGVIYGVIIIFSFMMIMKKNYKDIPIKYVVGVFSLFTALLIAASIPKDETLKGMPVLSSFLSNSVAIFKGELAQGGGLFGAALVALCSFLFDYTGTWLVIAGLIILGILVMLNRSILGKVKHLASHMKKPFQDRKERPKKKRKEKLEVSEEAAQEQVMSIDDRVKKGRVFLDVDDDFEDVIEEMEEPQESFSMMADEPTYTNTKEESQEASLFIEDYSHYKLPRLSLLKDNIKKGKSASNVTAANDRGRKLIEILDEFHVKASLVATHIGPSVTKFEIKPDLGVRVNKISNLQHDIKMALAAKDIRIEAPIPGKSAVGIEIPNVEKTAVYMKELIRNLPDSCKDKKLLFALGKDLMGECIYGELNKMPHLLIAGATGSGKSVCVNAIITSILMRTKPDEVKLLLVDPKKVEFTPYAQVPHLIGPVISDGEEANRALKVIVNMMDQRYELFSMAGVRNIAGYNAYIENHPEEGLKKMPWIVVVIDELADLMLVAAKEVESSIQRITQLARAAGIHLIVATQRPSVDVITGVIKANIPSRIAFAVSSAVDSRTILDQMGAEKLLGFGDMLYIPVGDSVATRVQGAFVSDEEVSAICEFVSKQARPKFDDAFLRLDAFDQENEMTQTSLVEDPLYEEVKTFVVTTRKASTSLVQRKFSVGYARAARLIDLLEERGIIGPSRGSKPREVYLKNEVEEEL